MSCQVSYLSPVYVPRALLQTGVGAAFRFEVGHDVRIALALGVYFGYTITFRLPGSLSTREGDKMTRKIFLWAVSAFLALSMFTPIGGARAEIMVPSPAVSPTPVAEVEGLRKSCDNAPAPDRSFFFDETASFSWTSMYHDGFSDRLSGFEAKEGYWNITIPALPALVTGPLSLFGVCDFVSRNFSILFSMAQQVKMSRADGWSVKMSGIVWLPRLEYRYCSEKSERGAFMCGAVRHTHASGGSGDLVNETALEFKQYIDLHRIKVDLREVNVVSLRYMWSMPFFHDRMLVQGDLAKNMFQIPFDAFLNYEKGFGFFDPGAQTSYEYPWAFTGKAAWHASSLLDLSLTVASELSEHKSPFMFEQAVDMYIHQDHALAFRLYHRWYGGMPDNSLNITQWGVWSNASATGFALVAHVPF